MGAYTLAEPKITATKGDCVTITAKAGETLRTFEVCWADAKIVKIEQGDVVEL